MYTAATHARIWCTQTTQVYAPTCIQSSRIRTMKLTRTSYLHMYTHTYYFQGCTRGGGRRGPCPPPPPPPPAQTYHPTFHPPKLSRALVWLVSLFGGYLAPPPSENPGYAPDYVAFPIPDTRYMMTNVLVC